MQNDQSDKRLNTITYAGENDRKKRKSYKRYTGNSVPVQ